MPSVPGYTNSVAISEGSFQIFDDFLCEDVGIGKVVILRDFRV
ncbi:MAG: hypothetical protein ACREX3_03010 [Gammaproteobacteria bacterium]